MNKTILTTSILSALLVGGLLLFNFYYSKSDAVNLQAMSAQESNEIAEVIDSEGAISWRDAQSSEFELLLSNKTEFNHLDVIQTSEKAHLILQFENGYEIKIQPSTELSLEYWDPTKANSQIYLNIIRGQYTLIKTGQLNSLFILKGQQLFPPEKEPTKKSLALNFRNQELKQVSADYNAAQTAPVNDTDDETVATSKSNLKSLTNGHIREELKKQSDLFLRCQTNSLRDTGQAAGKLIVGFTILPKGKTDGIKILESTVNKNFESCIVSVFERSKFHAFNGNPIVVSYPLLFD